jgi:hypothetical protein
VPLLLGGDLRFRLVERLRVVVDLAVLDLRAVGDFRVPAAFVPEFARVVVVFLRVVLRVVDRRVPVLAAADFRVEAAFVVDDDFRRGFAFAAEDFARDVDPAELDLLVVVDFLRLVVFDEPRSVSRFVRPAKTVVAFSSCATPLATSSCARATALLTALRSPVGVVERFDRLVLRAAICVSPVRAATPCAAVWRAMQ